MTDNRQSSILFSFYTYHAEDCIDILEGNLYVILILYNKLI